MAPPNPPSGSPRLVKVYLLDLQSREIIPERSIILQQPSFDVKIGRGSQTEACLHPQKSNAWFTSRVMSREHAVLRADPDAKKIYLEDLGSMHGTFLEGTRLEQGKPVAIRNNEKIQFGTEIVRGDQVYKPLQLSLGVDWDDCYLPSPTRTRPNVSIPPKNTFSIDYSDDEVEDDDDDDDIRFVSESISLLPAATYRQPRTFSVPDSDDTDSSENERAVENESAPSSPTELDRDTPAKNITSPMHAVLAQKCKEHAEKPTPLVPGATLQSALDVSDDEDDQEDVSTRHVTEPFDPVVNVHSEDNDDMSEGSYDEEPAFDSDFDEDDDEPDVDEDEEGAFNNTREQDHQLAETQQPVHHRAPSPSDAALPKLKWCPSNNLRNIPDVVEHQPPPPMTFSGVNGAFQPGPPPLSAYQPPFGYYTDMGWPNSHGNTGFNGSYDPVPELPSFTRVPSNLSPSINDPRFFQSPRFSEPMTDHFSLFNTAANDVSIKPSKVSINDIIDDVRSDNATVCNKRKRKAEEISNVEPEEEQQVPANDTQLDSTVPIQQNAMTEETSVSPTTPPDAPNEAIEAQPKPDPVSEETTPSKKFVTFSPDTVIINSDLQRPRKRIKVEQENSGNSFLKYFAATVAGATLGAVGTVFGLAALPVDYFG